LYLITTCIKRLGTKAVRTRTHIFYNIENNLTTPLFLGLRTRSRTSKPLAELHAFIDSEPDHVQANHRPFSRRIYSAGRNIRRPFSHHIDSIGRNLRESTHFDLFRLPQSTQVNKFISTRTKNKNRKKDLCH
jgi:hypothetical protein